MVPNKFVFKTKEIKIPRILPERAGVQGKISLGLTG